MKIHSDDRLSYIELDFQGSSSEDDFKIAGRQDVNLSVEISCNGFCGQNDSVWFGQDEIQDFLKEMRILEKERKGAAKLVSLGFPSESTEFHLQICSIDHGGHFALQLDLQKIRYSSRHELRPLKLSAGFELDSGDFANMIAEFETLFDFKRQ